jgi:hypothetical protein
MTNDKRQMAAYNQRLCSDRILAADFSLKPEGASARWPWPRFYQTKMR